MQMIAEPPSPLRRVLLYAHDTYGLGHLRRNLAIAKYLLETTAGLRVVLASGSPVADRFDLPQGLSVVPLPTVVKMGVDDYRPLDPGLDPGVVRRARAAIIADVARRFDPDILLVDHAPQGMKGELLPTFETLRVHCPNTRIVLGLRDILDDEVTVQRTWREQGVLDTLESVYDRVLVYGSRDVYDVVSRYGMPASVAARTSFCGYLGREPAAPLIPQTLGFEPQARFVLGLAGGGGDGLAALSAALEAAERLGVASVLLTGPLMGRRDRLAVAHAVSRSRNGHILEFTSRPEGLIAAASAVVTMGGYNILCELMAARIPTVVVPRIWPRREQVLRAELFAKRDLLQLVHPGSGLASRLLPAIANALDRGVSKQPNIDLNGLPRVRGFLLHEASMARRTRTQEMNQAASEAQSLSPLEVAR